MASSSSFPRSPRRCANSSDTELPQTPVRKRLWPRGLALDFGTPSPSSASSFDSPTRRILTRKRKREVNLEDTLRDCLSPPLQFESVLLLKEMPKDEQAVAAHVEQIVSSAKASVSRRRRKAKGKLLETELYSEWLEELSYVSSAIESALSTKHPNNRRRISGLGRISYTILYYLVDQFTTQVNLHHDGWSIPTSQSPSKSASLTMTLMEESLDPTSDERTEKAVQKAESSLKMLDRVMASAVKRYKAECGRNNYSLANKIGAQEHLLGKSCCLLCEQTGYGGGDDDEEIDHCLLEETRAVMVDWRQEYDDDEEDQLIDSDADDY